MNSKNYRNKSQAEWEKEVVFLISRDGKFCNKKNSHGCGRSFDQLIQEEERVRRMTNKQKKSPIIQIDHINANSFQRDGPNGEYCGNEQLLCTPCHLRKSALDRLVKRRIKLGNTTREPTPEMDKNIKNEPDWMATVTNYIYEKHSICFALARYGFPNLSDVTTHRYLKKRLVSIDDDTDPPFELGWGRCHTALCNGVHIYFYGNAPVAEDKPDPTLED
jgi:hypothetical protein